jgi:hypothetical protein
MDITITLAWWWVVPTIITVGGIIWAMCYDDGGGYFSGIGNVILLVPVLFVSLIAWIIAAFFK